METLNPALFKFRATVSTSPGLVPATKRPETRFPREDRSAKCRRPRLSESEIMRALSTGLRQADVSAGRASRAGAQEVVSQTETKGLRRQGKVSVWLPSYRRILLASLSKTTWPR